MTYVLGAKSLAALAGVHPALVSMVKAGIGYSAQDFAVHEGARELETQKEYVRLGVSRTMDSKHLAQKDGKAWAVDLVPYVRGVLRWEWALIYPIASAMQKAAQLSPMKLRWGGVWDTPLHMLPTGASGLKAAVEAYQVRHPGPDFIDGPHFELIP